MRELTHKEVDEVSGGVGVVGAALGAVTAGVSAAYGNGSVGEVIGASVLGGVSGFFGGIATSRYASGLTTAMFGAYSVETGVLASRVGS
jgi:lactobin A/cerein 7B family class IIb bacteriocin